jgi:hypothetical protein
MLALGRAGKHCGIPRSYLFAPLELSQEPRDTRQGPSGRPLGWPRPGVWPEDNGCYHGNTLHPTPGLVIPILPTREPSLALGDRGDRARLQAQVPSGKPCCRVRPWQVRPGSTQAPRALYDCQRGNSPWFVEPWGVRAAPAGKGKVRRTAPEPWCQGTPA